MAFHVLISKTLLSIIPKVINEQKTPINVDFLNENLDKLEKYYLIANL